MNMDFLFKDCDSYLEQKFENQYDSEELQIGDVVNYHSIIGGEITSKGHIIKAIEYAPNNYGCDVAWITDKSGCVAIRALSKEKEVEK